jgi:uncharacterized Tic20 family protein
MDTQQPDPPRVPTESEERTWGMVCHLAGLGTIVGALVAWVMLRDRSRFANEQGKESVNFQMFIAVCIFAMMFLWGVASIISPLGRFIYLVWVMLVGFDALMVILAAVKAANGEKFHYPVSLRMLK